MAIDGILLTYVRMQGAFISDEINPFYSKMKMKLQVIVLCLKLCDLQVTTF